jgi:hypothetical protein
MGFGRKINSNEIEIKKPVNNDKLFTGSQWH